MIRYITLVFLGMAVYGMLFGYVGAGILAGLMALLTWYAEGKFAQQDRDWHNNPANAQRLHSNTLHDLDAYECECMRAKDTA